MKAPIFMQPIFLAIGGLFLVMPLKNIPLFFTHSDILLFLHRYQPGSLSSPSQMEKLVELVEGEKVAVSGGDSGDEYGMERPLREAFTAKLLFCPSGKTPTQTSGNIVYATTAIICKCVWEKSKAGRKVVDLSQLINAFFNSK